MRIRFHHFLFLISFLSLPLAAQESGARWGLSSHQGVVGESIVLTLEIQGTDKFDPPSLAVPGVTIVFQGSSPRNSTSIVSVNGQTTKTVTKAWIGSWYLKSGSEGSYRLESLSVLVNNQTFVLPSLDWQITAAQKDTRFLLRQTLSRNVCVPGIELDYTLTWYIGEQAQNPEFTIPVLDNDNLVPVESSFSGVTGDTFQIQYQGRFLTGVKTTEQQGGRQVTALTFKFKIKPAKSGAYDLSGTMVTFEGAVDTRQVQDFFGNIIDQPVYRTLTAQAEPLTLLVKDLPAKGKPTPFSGLIGKLDLSWEGDSGTYSIGEPIRLKLKLDGVLNNDNLDLDHMIITALTGDDFQVSSDLSAKEEYGSRSFVFRAKRSGRLVIPSLSLNYFDPKTERYGVTATKPFVFDIKANAAGKNANGDSGGASVASDNGGQKGNSAGVAASGAGADDGAVTGDGEKNSKGAMMNPNGKPRSAIPSLPWWAFFLPGALCSVCIFPFALWRHSKFRILALERKTWKFRLGPLTSCGGREALAEGRDLLNSLLIAGELWKERLMASGQWECLLKQSEFWDIAFFSDGRGDEDWVGRWDSLRSEMGGWK